MVKRIKLLPGVFLTAVQTNKFKTGCFSLNFLRPLCRQEAANALLPNVLLRGSERYPDIPSVAAALDELYGASMGTLIRKKGEVQMTGFFADFVEDRLAPEPVFVPMMEFVSEILLHPVLENGVFRRDWFEVEKRNLLNAMEARINDKRSYANACMLDVMCENEPYAILRLGTQPELEELDAAGLYAQYRKVLAESRVELFYMGAKAPEEAADVLRRTLRELPRAEHFAQVETTVIPEATCVRSAEKHMDVTQGKLSLGLRTGCTVQDADFPALVVMNAVFGGGMTSKLFTKVREEQSLCYYAASTVDKFKGLMIVYSGVEFDKLETAKTEILRQLEACRAGDISEYEFESAKRYLLSDLKAAMDSPGRLDDFYLGQALLGSEGTLEALAEMIGAVTPEQVQKAANRLTLDTVFFLKGAEA